MSLISVFNNIYAAELSNYGFKKMKGIACFGRIINKDIFQYVMLINRKSLEKNKKGFTIISGIFTVYSPALNKVLFENYGNFFTDFEFMECLPHTELIKLCDLSYDTQSVHSNIKQSLEGFKSVMLPYLNQIITLNDYIGYCRRMKISLLKNAEQMWGDSILLLKTNNHDDFTDDYNRICTLLLREQYNNNLNDPDYIRTKKIYYDAIVVGIAQSRDRVYNDKCLYEQAMNLMEKRKKHNFKILKSYGFDIELC